MPDGYPKVALVLSVSNESLGRAQPEQRDARHRRFHPTFRRRLADSLSGWLYYWRERLALRLAPWLGEES